MTSTAKASEQQRSRAEVADGLAGRFAYDDRASPAESGSDLRLIWAALPEQRIRGVWWPRGRDIVVELSALLPVADAFLGAPMIRMSLNPRAWDHQPKRLHAGTRVIRLAWFTSIDQATVGIGATPAERFMLCVVPPEWTADAGRRLFRALRKADRWPTEASELFAYGAEPSTQDPL